MKHLPVFLALALAPRLALAQTMTGPVPPTSKASQHAVPVTNLPDADKLLGHLFDPYEAAKTYRGTFDVSLKGDEPKQKTPFSSLHIQTLFRFNAQGDKERETTTLSLVGKVNGHDQRQTLQFVDDGKTMNLVYVEQKAWHTTQRTAQPFLRLLLQPILEQVAQGMNEDPGFAAAISKEVDAGRSVYVLHDKEGRSLVQFRAVIDAQTRALRSLELSGDGGNTNGISVRGSHQTFNAPVPDAEFKWTPPAGFRLVKEGSIPLPPFLSSVQAAPKPTQAPNPAPTQPKSPPSQ